MAFRSSTGSLAHNEEPRRGPERWDRDKFERFSRRGVDEREVIRLEDDRNGRHDRLEIEIEDSRDRKTPRTRVEERHHQDHSGRSSRNRLDFLDRPDPAEAVDRALAPYRRTSIHERGMELTTSRRPARPQFMRRQSSLDTFDRRPLPKYGDKEHDEWRPPANVPIPLPIRRRSPSRRHSPPRNRYREEDYEEIRHRDYDSEGREDEYRDIHVKREKSRHRRKSRARSHAPSRKSSVSSSSSSFEEISPVRKNGKRGRTRMPKRLVHKSAIVQLGYPFEEEDDFYIVQRALEKEQIDEVIKISETYKEKSSTTYKYEEKSVRESEPAHAHYPPPPASVHSHAAPSEIVIPAPPPPEIIYAAPPPPPILSPLPARSVRSASPPRHEIFEERIEEHNYIGGPLTVVAPSHRHRSERDIQREIRELEREQRVLRIERDDRHHETEYEIVERREPERNVVRLDRDRKARKPPNPKLVAAMMATLS